MSEAFDPYQQWLGIRDRQRPPHLYALLGLPLLESDQEKIARAADLRIALVRKLADDAHADAAQKLLKELAAARAYLANAEKKAAYDAKLRARINAAQEAAKPAPLPKQKAEDLLPPQAEPVRAAAVVPEAAPVAQADQADLQFELVSRAPKRDARRQRRSAVPWIISLVALIAAGVSALAFAHRQGWLTSAAAAPAVAPQPAPVEPEVDLPTAPQPTAPKRPVRRPPRRSKPASDATEPPAGQEEMTTEQSTEPEQPDQPLDQPAEPAEPKPEVKQPVPDAKSLKAALAELRQRFAFDYEKARSVTDFRTFGRKLYEAASKAEEQPALRFAMFGESRRLFVETDATPAALETINAQARVFEIDPLPMRKEVLETIGPRLKDPEALYDHTLAVLETAQAAMAAEDFKLAQELARLANTLGKSSGDELLAERIKDFNRDLRTCQQAFKSLQEQRQALAANPGDQAAHAAVGQFAAIYQGDFPAAAEHLAAGTPGPWQVAGQRELARPSAVADQVAAGDAWWDAAEELSAIEQAAVRRRALYWYERAIPRLADAELARVQSRVAELFGRTKIWATGPAEKRGQEGALLGHEEVELPDTSTLEFWFVTRAETATLITKRKTADDRSLTLVLRKGQLVFVADGKPNAAFETLAAVNDGNWHHAAVVREAAQASVFLDGRPLGSFAVGGEFRSSGPWRLGYHPVEASVQGPAVVQFARIRVSNVARYANAFVPERAYGKDRRTVFFE
ncbi:MAG: hypothetical protein K1X74_04295 [Pirellulales bacterium]|nr:hypothetical protein [Pirellulales bacterium]